MATQENTPEPKGGKAKPGKVEPSVKEKEPAAKERPDRPGPKESNAAKEKADKDRQVREKDKRARENAATRKDSGSVSKTAAERKATKADTGKRSSEAKEAEKSKGAEKTGSKTPEKRAGTGVGGGNKPPARDIKRREGLDKLQKSLVDLAGAGAKSIENPNDKEARNDLEKAAKQIDSNRYDVKIETHSFEDGRGREVTVTCKDKVTGQVHSVEYHSGNRGESLSGSTTSSDGKKEDWLRERQSNSAERPGSYNPEYKQFFLGNQVKRAPQRREEKAPKTAPAPTFPKSEARGDRPPHKDPVIDQKTLDRIKAYEGKGRPGKPLQRYIDDVGVPTVGYGHTSQSGESLPERVTEEEAEELLKQDIRRMDRKLDKLIKVPLSTGQRRALRSFAFNLGPGKIKALAPFINRGDFDGAAKKVELYDKARDRRTGQLKALPGLTKRRKEEAEELRGERLVPP